MQRHLFLYAWICVALAAGISVCLGLIAHMLLTQQPQAIYANAQFVKEAISRAAV